MVMMFFDELLEKVNSLLNEVTPQNVEDCCKKIESLPVTSEFELRAIVWLLQDKAVGEPGFSGAYALMCKVLSYMQVPVQHKTNEDPEFVNFQTLIANRCHTELEKIAEAQFNKDAKFAEINREEDLGKKIDLVLILEENKRQIRMKYVGNIRFIGELFKVKMLTEGVLLRCINLLLTAGDEVSLECLCALLTIIGKDLDSQTALISNAIADLQDVYDKMHEIAIKLGSGSVSSRMRCMLQEVIELRQGKWVLRRDDANPKTMDQIQKEAEKEPLDMHIALNSNQTPGWRYLGRWDGMETTSKNMGRFSSWKTRESSKKENTPNSQCKKANLFSVPGAKSTGYNDKRMAPPMLSIKYSLPSFIGKVHIQDYSLYKSVLAVLNKLTPQKFDTLVSQVKALPIDNCDKLTCVINLVFKKAVDEPGFSVAYALMCKVLSDMKVPAERKTPDDPEFVNFRKLIVNRCQTEFEKNSEAKLNKDAKVKEINLQTDPEKKKELMLIFEEEERRIRMKSVGNIKFIGELFKLKMLTAGIMHRCIGQLLTAGDEESLECLCKLLTTIGKDLESKEGPKFYPYKDLSQYFSKMREIASKRGPGSVSSRVRFMLQDVIELRQGKWVPRRDDTNPRAMDQIQKEAENLTSDMHIALNSNQTPGRRNDDCNKTTAE